MTVIIEELHAELTEQPQTRGEGEPRPSEGQTQQITLDLIELAQERKARLVVD